MIISHKYRYLFIELPLTASTAIAKELVENYDGEEILYKHATYRSFLKQATEDEKDYFVFIGIRNPLDQAVSHYYKYLDDHKGKYSKPQARKSGRLKYWINERGHQSRFRFIHDTQADFEQFFMEFHKNPFMDWSLLDDKRMNGLIRFENIQEDFKAVLVDIGIEQKRPLPEVNKTKVKKKGFEEHYTSDPVRKRAAEVFGPYMKRWGYRFSPEWNVNQYMDRHEQRFNRMLRLKRIYWAAIS